MNELGSQLFNAGPNFKIGSVLMKLRLVKVSNKMGKSEDFMRQIQWNFSICVKPLQTLYQKCAFWKKNEVFFLIVQKKLLGVRYSYQVSGILTKFAARKKYGFFMISMKNIFSGAFLIRIPCNFGSFQLRILKQEGVLIKNALENIFFIEIIKIQYFLRTANLVRMPDT